MNAFPRDLTKLTPEQALRLLDSANKELAERHLYEFHKQGWGNIDPASFVDGWHLDAIGEHVEGVMRGQIRKLLINQPPRTDKSTFCSVCLPPWTWAQKPDKRYPLMGPGVQFLYASYAQSLSVRDSVKSRRLIESPWYQKNWGDRFHLTGDQNTKIRFETNKGGYRLATSVDGALTGEGGAIIVVDDPHNTRDAESEAVRESTLAWWDESMSTRLNDPKTGAFIIVMQRLHENDLSGHILSKDEGEWTHLMLPMRYEPARTCVTVMGFEDPRTEEGELLWPDRFGEPEVIALERSLGPYAAAGQLQQSPSPRGGGIIKRDWWQMWPPEGQEAAWQIPVEVEDQVTGELKTVYRNTFPDFEYIIASCDTAYTEKQENDYSACVVLGVFRDHKQHPKIMLIQAWQERLELHALVTKILRTCEKRGCDAVVVEAKASGKSVAQEIRRLMRPGAFNVTEYDPKNGDKVARMYAVQPLFSAGTVYAPDTSWAELVIAQTETFPKGAHDDLVDALAQGLQYLRKRGLAQLTYEAEEDDVRARTFRGKSETVRDSYGV